MKTPSEWSEEWRRRVDVLHESGDWSPGALEEIGKQIFQEAQTDAVMSAFEFLKGAGARLAGAAALKAWAAHQKRREEKKT